MVHPRMSNRLGLYQLVPISGSHEMIFTNQIVEAAATKLALQAV
jgi:hypothetical protein